MPTFNRSNKKIKPGKRIAILLVIIILGWLFLCKNVHLEGNVTLKPGENVAKIWGKLSTTDQFRVKIYLRMHRGLDFSRVEPGTYEFSGAYSRSQFISTILAGPANKYIKITVLEGRSIYDIDASLTKKGLINQGEYIALVTDPTIIAKYQKKYQYLSTLPPFNLSTLEGFLYPDTYNVDAGNNIVDQLVYLQLENFKNKISNYQIEISALGVEWQDKVILASVVEKEEKNPNNKATVAGIFYKRLNIGMKLDADITLCYGLKTSYADCTPHVIAKNIDDANNVYNTRANRGLPPTPIANPSIESIVAVLHPQSSEYLYYLHGSDGVIHYGRTLDEHNNNKRMYLK